jgi:hypothetical protein
MYFGQLGTLSRTVTVMSPAEMLSMVPLIAEAPPRCELDREEAQVAADGQPRRHGIAGRHRHQRRPDAHR